MVVGLGTFTRLLRRASRYWHVLVASMACMVIATSLNLVVPMFVREIVDQVLLEGRHDRLMVLSLAIVGVTALRGVVSFAQRYAGEYVGQRVAFDLRNSLFASLQEKSFSFFDRARTGQLMSRATNDVDTVRMFLSFGMQALVGSLLTVGGILAIVVSMDVRLTLLSLLTFPLLFAFTFRFARRIRPLFDQSREVLGAMNSVLQENIVGTRVVRLFAREAFEEGKFADKNRRYLELGIEASRLRSTFIPLMILTLNLGTIIVYWYGGRGVIAGGLSLGSLIAFNGYMTMLVMPVRFMGFLVAFLQNAMAGVGRVFEIIDTRSEVREKPEAVELPPVKGEVRFVDVHFGYGEDKPILRGLNLTAKPMETIALVGATGSGKSTVINLIPRFYDIDSGRVMIDGHDVRDVTLKSLRGQIGIVAQETFLFQATIRENISYGRPGASMEEVVQAAGMAQAHDFITNLPDGYETVVGERGVTL
ncbi:MAG: ABC transporter ATP-binding protein, partial [Candidatus Bathyarchaeia archaeon]